MKTNSSERCGFVGCSSARKKKAIHVVCSRVCQQKANPLNAGVHPKVERLTCSTLGLSHTCLETQARTHTPVISVFAGVSNDDAAVEWSGYYK